jgi:hypothetical protein
VGVSKRDGDRQRFQLGLRDDACISRGNRDAQGTGLPMQARAGRRGRRPLRDCRTISAQATTQKPDDSLCIDDDFTRHDVCCRTGNTLGEPVLAIYSLPSMAHMIKGDSRPTRSLVIPD